MVRRRYEGNVDCRTLAVLYAAFDAGSTPEGASEACGVALAAARHYHERWQRMERYAAHVAEREARLGPTAGEGETADEIPWPPVESRPIRRPHGEMAAVLTDSAYTPLGPGKRHRGIYVQEGVA